MIYADIELQIHKLLETSIVETLPICIRMVDIIIHMADDRNRASSIAIDLPAAVSQPCRRQLLLTRQFPHTIGAVTILGEALRQFPAIVPGRFRVIRQLSVYAHEMNLNCGPGRLNNAYCLQTLIWLNALLDEVLDGLSNPISLDNAFLDSNMSGSELFGTESTISMLDDPALAMDQSWEQFWDI